MRANRKINTLLAFYFYTFKWEHTKSYLFNKKMNTSTAETINIITILSISAEWSVWEWDNLNWTPHAFGNWANPPMSN